MNTDFLSPVEESLVAQLVSQSPLSLGQKVKIHSQKEGIPDLENVQIAILGVQEDRNSQDNFGCGEAFSLYS